MRLILLLMSVTCGAVYGQTGKGSFMIGGTVALQNNKGESIDVFTGGTSTTSATSAWISPTVGFFCVDNLALGLSLSLSGSKSKAPGVKGTSVGIEAGPSIRYYFPFGKFAVFPTAGAAWGNTKQTTKFDGSGIPDQTDNWTVARFKAGAGIAWFVANNVAVEGILAYQRQHTGPSENKYDVNIVAFNVGLQFFIPSKGTQSKE